MNSKCPMNHSVDESASGIVLHLSGELDALTVDELRPTLDELAGRGERPIVVDLSGLRLIDSSGVGALVSLYKRVRENGGHVEFAGVREQPLAIFKLLRLDLVFGL